MIFAKTLKYHYVFKVLWNSGVAKIVLGTPRRPEIETFIILTEINGFECALLYKKQYFCKTKKPIGKQ